MFSQALLLSSLLISRCSAHVVSHNRHVLGLHDSDTNTITSTDLSTETETMHETTTLSTTSLQTASVTDRSTLPSGDSTQVVTVSSTPTTTVTKSSVSTINIDQTYRTVTEKETVTTTAQLPQTKTRIEEVPAPKATCCTFSNSDGPYPKNLPESPVDITCLHPRWRQSFRRHIDPTLNNKSFCAMSTPMLHDFFIKVFNGACYHGEWPAKDRDDIAQENELHVKCFAGFMENLCGFHIITNTGHEIDDMCGKNW
ncbi:hypothetical protein QM012_005509 [Aureobasidium pullulans]|uniref:Uncharacterized protein n=1 Tax=Aureobasidium pullulans TaxID=5580 RepID=A0ABR0T4W5_AURPU